MKHQQNNKKKYTRYIVPIKNGRKLTTPKKSLQNQSEKITEMSSRMNEKKSFLILSYSHIF